MMAILLGTALITASCGEKAPETPEVPPVETPPAPSEAAPESPLTEVPPPPTFSTPLVEETRPTGVGSLRKATDPDERIKSIQSGRPDPFAANPIAVTVTLPKLPSPLSLGAGNPPSTTTNPGLPPLPSLPTLQPGITLPPDPDLVVVPPILLPNPTLAKAVVVTGVVQVGSSLQAIVKAPLEPTSRYVSTGQRIANGQVLVKRIEVRGSEPVVVLEQLGIEVVKFVGAPAEALPQTAGQSPVGVAPISPASYSTVRHRAG